MRGIEATRLVNMCKGVGDGDRVHYAPRIKRAQYRYRSGGRLASEHHQPIVINTECKRFKQNEQVKKKQGIRPGTFRNCHAGKMSAGTGIMDYVHVPSADHPVSKQRPSASAY